MSTLAGRVRKQPCGYIALARIADKGDDVFALHFGACRHIQRGTHIGPGGDAGHHSVMHEYARCFQGLFPIHTQHFVQQRSVEYFRNKARANTLNDVRAGAAP